MYTDLPAKYLYYRQVLMKSEFSRQILKKYSYIKFHENSTSWSPIIPCGGMQRPTSGRMGREI
jgi:hypothetical protein